MSRTIHKYEIFSVGISRPTMLDLPEDAECVLLSDKDGCCHAWFLFDVVKPVIRRQFVLLGTCFSVPV